MRFKKAFALAFLPILALASCGGGEDDTSGKRVLRFEFLKAGFGTEVYEELAKMFEAENPDVTVKLIPNKDIRSETPSKLSSGKNLADLYLINNSDNNIRLWSEEGLVEPLDDLFSSEVEDGKTFSDAMDDLAEDFAEFNGHYWMVPEYYNISGFVYNATTFETLGLSVPTTIDELKQVCESIRSQTDSVDPIIYCGTSADGYLYYWTDQQVVAYEGVSNMKTFYEYGSAENFAPENSVGKIKALTSLRDIFYTSGYSYDRSMNTDYISAQTSLIKGTAAMMLNGSWFENEMGTIMNRYPDQEIKMFAVPEAYSNGSPVRSETYTTEDDKPILNSGFSANYFIPADAANKDDAKAFLKFMARQDVLQAYTRLSNSVRPFDYDYSPDAEAYADMSSFGKSVLEIANSHCLYVAVQKNPVALRGEISLWPSGKIWNYELYNDTSLTPEDCIQTDYEYVTSHWDGWFGS